jgi:uncharacterized membrane protein (Fun14 family)
MPAWHRHVLLAAMGLAVIGTIGRVRQFVQSASSPGSATTATPHGGFPNGTPADSPEVPASAVQPWYLSPRFLSFGASVLAGFLIGWAIRLFVKTTVLVGLALAAVFGVLSHIHLMNVDFTSVQQQYSGALRWLSDQASRLKDVAIAHLPVHAGGLLGVLMGFQRRKL